MESPWLHRFALLLALCTLVLVIDGGGVATVNAGLPPSSAGQSATAPPPPGVSALFSEQGHRMAGIVVGILALGLAIWLSAAAKRRWLANLGWVTLAVAVVQGLLGGMSGPTGSQGMSVAHACVAPLFLSLVAAMAVFTSPAWQKGPELGFDQGWPSLRSLAIFAPLLVLMQIMLGAAFRHKFMGVIPHIGFALLVALVIIIVATFVTQQFPAHSSLAPSAKVLLGITIVQVMLGMGALWARMQSVITAPALLTATVAHVTVGALTFASSIVLAIQIRRNVQKRPEEEEEVAPAV